MRNTVTILSSALTLVLASPNISHAAAASAESVDDTPRFSGDGARRPMATAVVTQASPDLYYGKRRADDTDLAFGMARLTQATLPFWLDFVCGQYAACAKAWFELCPANLPPEKEEQLRRLFELIDLTESPNKDGIRAGLCAFQESLRIFRDYNYQPEIWITYALSGAGIDPAQPITQALFPHIEMVVTVMTSPQVPVTAHMGITRTVYHEVAVFKKELPKHERLSIALHGFAAKTMKYIYPSKVWMVTAPVAKMADILQKVLPARSSATKDEITGIFAELPPLEREWFLKHRYLEKPSHAVSLDVLADQFA